MNKSKLIKIRFHDHFSRENTWPRAQNAGAIRSRNGTNFWPPLEWNCNSRSGFFRLDWNSDNSGKTGATFRSDRSVVPFLPMSEYNVWSLATFEINVRSPDMIKIVNPISKSVELSKTPSKILPLSATDLAADTIPMSTYLEDVNVTFILLIHF